MKQGAVLVHKCIGARGDNSPHIRTETADLTVFRHRTNKQKQLSRDSNKQAATYVKTLHKIINKNNCPQTQTCGYICSNAIQINKKQLSTNSKTNKRLHMSKPNTNKRKQLSTYSKTSGHIRPNPTQKQLPTNSNLRLHHYVQTPHKYTKNNYQQTRTNKWLHTSKPNTNKRKQLSTNSNKQVAAYVKPPHK